LVEDLEFFEIRKTPVVLFVTQRLSHLEASLQSGILKPPISQEIKSKFEDNNFEMELYIT
ncbi:18970_t:CDS:1, partial [Gigaspora margarita]